MSQSHEKQLNEALRVVCGGEKSGSFSELGDEIVKAIRKRLLRSLNWQRFRTGSI